MVKINQKFWGPVGVCLSIGYQVYTRKTQIQKSPTSGTMENAPPPPIQPPLTLPIKKEAPPGNS